jgi:hypothetical protein
MDGLGGRSGLHSAGGRGRSEGGDDAFQPYGDGDARHGRAGLEIDAVCVSSGVRAAVQPTERHWSMFRRARERMTSGQKFGLDGCTRAVSNRWLLLLQCDYAAII